MLVDYVHDAPRFVFEPKRSSIIKSIHLIRTVLSNCLRRTVVGNLKKPDLQN